MSEVCVANLGQLGIAPRLLEANREAENPDGELARGLREHDPMALAKLYDRFGRIAFSVILRAVHDRAVAEDLVQETFLRIWNRAASFDAQRGELGSWVATVARNRAIDYLRSVSGRMAAGEIPLRAEDAFPHEKDEVLAIDRKSRLEKAFRKLTPRQRELIRLAYYEGLSHVEMARRLEKPLGTVKTWVAVAMRVLREELT